MAPPVLVPYLLGLVTAPLMAKVVKPLLRGTVKTTVGLALQVKKVAAEAVEDVQDLAAEASAEMVAAEMASAQRAAEAAPKAGSSPVATTATVTETTHSRGGTGTTRRGGTA